MPGQIVRLLDVYPLGPDLVLALEYMVTDLAEVGKSRGRVGLEVSSSCAICR
jgi:hypothetical protein